MTHHVWLLMIVDYLEIINTIISRTPLRISLAGGGSDIPEYYKNNKLGKVFKHRYKSLSLCHNKKKINITDYKFKLSKRV